jgi:hypothetical protein
MNKSSNGASAPGTCGLLLSTALVAFHAAGASAHGPPKKKRGLFGTALKTANVLATYRVADYSQVEKQQLRNCVACGSPVSNRNLGGFAGRSALSGKLFCLACADIVPPGCFLAFEGKAPWRSSK